MDSRTALQLSGWRREVAQLYAQVRASADSADGHALWRAGREKLFLHHPQSPLAADHPIRSTLQTDARTGGGIRLPHRV